MATVRNSRVSRTIPLLIAVCLVSIPAQAQYGGGSGTTASAETNTYVFLPGQSTVVQTGGIAGVHETYPIEGQFRLTVDFDAGTALFSQVDANLVDESPFLPTESLGELFNMAELLGTVVDDTIIDFVGKSADGMESDILLTLTFRDDSAHLTGRTVPPPNSADFFLFSLDAVAQIKYGGGTGEPNDPYLIYTAEQMNTIGAEPNDWDKHFKLMADIDLSNYTGTDFNIIGIDRDNAFTGVFNGSGHRISNFSYISTDRNYIGLSRYCIGLFGYVRAENALIKDLGLIDPNVDAEIGRYVGLLVGWVREGSITGCYVNGGSVLGGSDVGGLVGALDRGTIDNCYSSGDVSGVFSVGGLVGTNGNTITNCYATGSVLASGTEWRPGVGGGLVGQNWGTITITNCYATGSVTGTTNVGGLIGSKSEYGTPTVTDSFWDIETSGQSISAGGTGKTTAEMQMATTFLDAGWDFVGESVNGTEDIWSICEGTNYPRLARQIPAGDFVCPDGITIEDFVFFIEHWRDDNCDLSNDYCQGTDLDFSGTVDEADLEILVENWLESSELEN